MATAAQAQTTPAQTSSTATIDTQKDNSPIDTLLVTGNLIHGDAAIGNVPTVLTDKDFKESGAVTIGDILLNVPAVTMIADSNVINGGGYVARDQNINIRNLSLHGTRTLIMVDGMRFPNQGTGGCQTDPSIIPQLAVDNVEVLTDGASATYGSDAIAGVVNVHLKRGYEGFKTQLQYGQSLDVGGPRTTYSALYGKVWDGGDITISAEHYNTTHIEGASTPSYTADFRPYGFDDRRLLVDSRPGIIAYTSGSSTASVATAFPGGPANLNSQLMGQICNNCYSIPTGQNGVGLTWAAIIANPGVKNQINEFTDAWQSPQQSRDAATMTFDQRLTSNTKLFIDATVSVRGTLNHNSPGGNSFTLLVPSNNPYFPTGAPAAVVTSGINEYVDFEDQSPIIVHTNETASRFNAGLNIDLPFNWYGKTYASISRIHEFTNTQGSINQNALKAAVGQTVPQVNVSTTTPGILAYTKPANIPFFNPFCDSTSFSNCNDPKTMAYIEGFSKRDEAQNVWEYGAIGDGPIMDLPAGTLKAAVGAIYTSFTYNDVSTGTNANDTQFFTNTSTYGQRNSISGYLQLDIPVFGPKFNLPGVEKLDVEAAVRYDKYNQAGNTTNPKISVGWFVAGGLKLFSTWGTSFRAPSFQENVDSGPSTTNYSNGTPTLTSGTAVCAVTGVPAKPGTIAAIINPNCTAALNYPVILQAGAGSSTAALRPGGVAIPLKPEKGMTWIAGFDFAPRPTDGPLSVLSGLDFNMTYWSIRITNAIQGAFRLAGFTNGSLNDPNYVSAFIIPSTYSAAYSAGLTGTAAQQQVLMQAKAALDPVYTAKVAGVINATSSTIATSTIPAVELIADTGTKNIGWQSLNGVDYNLNYDWEMGNHFGVDWGSWNTGVSGTYNIKNESQDVPGQPIVSNFTLNNDSHWGKIRAHLGWRQDGDAGSGLSITTFANYIGPFNPTNNPLPPACFQIGNAACSTYGAPWAQYTTQSNLTTKVHAVVSFDLSIGYDFGNLPSNDLLKGTHLQLSMQNVLDTKPPFQYAIASPGGGKPHAFYTSTASSELSPNGRTINIALSKDW